MDKFFQVPNEIFETKTLSIYHKMVMIYLFRVGNQGSPIYPSYSTIAKKCGMSRNKAIQVMSDLQSLCIIEVKQRRKGLINNTNLYSINRQALMDLIVNDMDTNRPGGINTNSLGLSDKSPSAQDSPPLVHDVIPIKNNYDKEPSIKNHSTIVPTSTASPLWAALTFQDYKKQYEDDADPEAIEAIEYFIDYKKSVHGDHKKMTKASWDSAAEEIFDLYKMPSGEPKKHGKCDWDEFTALVECYFDKLGQFQEPCDYSIPHFNSPGVKGILFYDAAL